jgi:tetratricopeptide (TPR) repeat protein
VPAQSPLDAGTALAALAVRLGSSPECTQPDLVRDALDALAARDDWLLIFDNATTPADLEPLLPAAGGRQVLITSRTPAWHGLATPVPVDLLTLTDATRLLQARTGDPDQHAAEQLAQELGRLPLAVEQAGAYAAEQQLSLAAYLELFTRERARLLGRGRPLAYAETVDATVMLTVSQLPPAVVHLLRVCALLAPDKLPIDQVLEHADRLGDPLASAARDPTSRAELLGALRRTSLLAADPDGTSRIHRLVQAVLLAYIPDPDRATLVARSIDLLCCLWPDDPGHPAIWPVCARLLPHLEAVFAHTRQQQLATPALAGLLRGARTYIWGRQLGRDLARELDVQVLSVYRRLHGDTDHPDIASSLHDLSSDLFVLGDYQHARELGEQALAMYRRLHGDIDHPDIANGVTNLADVLFALGDYQHARELFEQALAMYRRLYGDADHPAIAANLNSLGIALTVRGDHQRARELYEQALAMHRRLYGDIDHPGTATLLSNVASAHATAGNYERARELYEQALGMHRRLHGDADRSGIAGSLTGLANALFALGDHERARELHEQALAMYRRVHGDTDHPDIAEGLTDLARDLRVLREHERADDVAAEAAAMRARLPPWTGPRIGRS